MGGGGGGWGWEGVESSVTNKETSFAIIIACHLATGLKSICCSHSRTSIILSLCNLQMGLLITIIVIYYLSINIEFYLHECGKAVNPFSFLFVRTRHLYQENKQFGNEFKDKNLHMYLAKLCFIRKQ